MAVEAHQLHMGLGQGEGGDPSAWPVSMALPNLESTLPVAMAS